MKRVILTMGGKGGVGKTSFVLCLAEWLKGQGAEFTMLDLDTENKSRGSLKHYFEGAARKVDIHTPAGLDAFIDCLDDGPKVILADMGAGSGWVAHEWFDTMFESAQEMGIAFTAVGIITPDPASVESVLSWAKALQHKVQYVIVENEAVLHADFSYWRLTEQAEQFRQIFNPITIPMKYRLPDLENPARQYGATLGEVAARRSKAPELERSSLVARAQGYQRQIFQDLDRSKELFLV
ncbi:MAG TPA: P-loop NTPase [Bryobacteraceae bacterium]|nr:P-loop NTPase [Bryobacteraceae bacterium]